MWQGAERVPPIVEERSVGLPVLGVGLHSAGRPEAAVALWREALGLDPDNLVIRSQIWVAEHPERLYPAVDRSWQELQLLKEGYDKPLP